LIDHVVLGVSDLARSRSFCTEALAPLGISILLDRPGYIGFGDSRPFFFLASRDPSIHVHVAFAVQDRGSCDAFHRAAIAAGGTDEGAPGVRPIYHTHYYGAFVLDGNSIEAVCHSPSVASPE
jgi:catechol 2,3-dioxygenase-like lactoylglutathione lyase family enzyme